MSSETPNLEQCFFQISIAGDKPRLVVFDLFSEICPETCANFKSFCDDTHVHDRKSYRNSIFHRVIPGFMVQGGDYENNDGSGGEAYHGGKLKDENFEIKHDREGILSMANRGKDTAGSQFFITLNKCMHLDGKHVAFGRVSTGIDVIKDMATVECDQNDKPVKLQTITITDCGIGNGHTQTLNGNDRHTQLETTTRKHKKRNKHDDKYQSTSASPSDTDSSSSYHDRKKHKRSKVSSKSSSKKHHSHSSRHKKRKHYAHDDDHDDDVSTSESNYSSRDKHKHHSRKDKKHKKHKKSSHKHSRHDRDDTTKKRRKKHHSKERKKYYSSSSSSNSSSDDDINSSQDYSGSEGKYSRRRKKSKKSTSKEKINSSSLINSHNSNATFGKYGIIKDADLHQSMKVRRSFEVWLEEVKGIPQSNNMSKGELMTYFKDFAEDYNTATLPHQKYYDYDKWEMNEYQKQKEDANRKGGAITDEFRHAEEVRRKAAEKQRKEFELVKNSMSKEKIEEMKNQVRLKAELVNAYKVGDVDKRKKLQRRLEPDEK